jgi:hypothetical protein
MINMPVHSICTYLIIATEDISRPKADPSDPGQVGAPMSGVVVEVRVHAGSIVKKGDPIAVLSAMYPSPKTFLTIGKWRWSFPPPTVEKLIKLKSVRGYLLFEMTLMLGFG